MLQWIWLKIGGLSQYRSSHQKYFIKKGVLKNITKFRWKHLYRSLLFSDSPCVGVFSALHLYWKGDSDTGVFLWILPSVDLGKLKASCLFSWVSFSLWQTIGTILEKSKFFENFSIPKIIDSNVKFH